MLRGRFSNSTIWIQAFLWLAILLGLTIAVMGVWFALPIDHQSTASLKWFQFIQTSATFLLPPLCLALLCSQRPWAWLTLNQVPKWSLWACAIVIMLIALPGINLLADWNSRMSLPAFLQPLEELMRQQEEAAQALTERFLRGKGVGILLINIGLIALLPAAAEELTFRGTLQRLAAGQHPTGGTALTRRQHIAIWAIAILFSAIHFQFYGFVPRMLLGALFGYALCLTGSLWIPIVMHFTNNAATVLAYWIVYNNDINPDGIETFGTGETTWIGALSILLTVGGIYLFWRLSRTISNASSRIS